MIFFNPLKNDGARTAAVNKTYYNFVSLVQKIKKNIIRFHADVLKCIGLWCGGVFIHHVHHRAPPPLYDMIVTFEK